MTNKEAIKVIKHLYEANPIEEEEALNLAIKALKERPQGEWVVDEFGRKICGKCQFPFAEFQSDNYCSLCGAKMQKGGAENG